MNETMLTYIKKEQQTDERVLFDQDKNLKPFYDWLKLNQKTRWVILATGSSANAIEAARYYVEKIAAFRFCLVIMNSRFMRTKCISLFRKADTAIQRFKRLI